jgi:hypothetical protein
MAIDTALKRFSIVHLGSPWRGVVGIADSNVTPADRYVLVGLYSGLVAAAPVLLSPIGNISAGFDTGTHEFDLSGYFSGQTTYAISPAVEVGWTFDTNTGVLTIDTDDAATFGPYTVTASSTGGDTDSNTFTVKVSASSAPIYGDFTFASPFSLSF